MEIGRGTQNEKGWESLNSRVCSLITCRYNFTMAITKRTKKGFIMNSAEIYSGFGPRYWQLLPVTFQGVMQHVTAIAQTSSAIPSIPDLHSAECLFVSHSFLACILNVCALLPIGLTLPGRVLPASVLRAFPSAVIYIYI